MVVPITVPGILSVPVSLIATEAPPLTVPVTARFGVSFSVNPAAEKLPRFAIVLLPVSAALPALLPVSSAAIRLPASVMPPAPAVSVNCVAAVTLPLMEMPAPFRAVVAAVMLPGTVRVPMSVIVALAPPLTVPITARFGVSVSTKPAAEKSPRLAI